MVLKLYYRHMADDGEECQIYEFAAGHITRLQRPYECCKRALRRPVHSHDMAGQPASSRRCSGWSLHPTSLLMLLLLLLLLPHQPAQASVDSGCTLLLANGVFNTMASNAASRNSSLTQTSFHSAAVSAFTQVRLTHVYSYSVHCPMRLLQGDWGSGRRPALARAAPHAVRIRS